LKLICNTVIKIDDRPELFFYSTENDKMYFKPKDKWEVFCDGNNCDPKTCIVRNQEKHNFYPVEEQEKPIIKD